MEDNLVLVDGDICVYRVGFASEDTNWGICKARVNKMLEEILENTDSSVMFGFLTDGKNNFRNKVAVTKPYKGNRPPAKPKHYIAIREYLQEEHGFEMHITQEADDAIGIAHAEMGDWKVKDSGIVMASIDKDLLMIPGYHYNIRRGVTEYVSINGAKFNYFSQVLTGDSTDNIDGIRGIGPVKAKNILEGCNSTQSQCQAVIEAYSKANMNFDLLSETAELIWIRRELPTVPFSWKLVEDTYNRYKE